jgi:LEA14-like dessication related protein
MKYSIFLFLLLSLTSCFKFEEVEFKGVEEFKMPKINDKQVVLNLVVKVENPNNYKIKIKSSDMEVFVEEKMIGTLHLVEKIVIRKKKEDNYMIQASVDLEKGALFSMAKYALKKEINIRIKGKVKGSVMGVSKKIDINQSSVIAGNKLNLNFFQ